MVPQLRIVSATRHEADNVGPLTSQLRDALHGLDITWELLFVDDSDDNTPEAVRALASSDERVRLLHRPSGDRRGGLSGALNVGFVTSDNPLVLVIDADLQHPPDVVPRLLAPLLAGTADVVIGSRYVEGGSAGGLSGPVRYWASRAATWTVQGVFPPLRQIKDPVSGFFAFRADVIDQVELRPEGFKMLVELLVRGRWDHAVEVPFIFAGRAAGVSNVSPRLGLYFLRHVARLWADTRAPNPIAQRFRPNPATPLGPMTDEQGEPVTFDNR